MRNIIEKVNCFIYYQICEKYPVTEYAVGAFNSLNATIAIMDMCPWTFSPLEVTKLFLVRYAETVISIAIAGMLWVLYGKEMATALFDAFTMPGWMLALCLFSASKIFARVLSEVLFGHE